MRITNNMISDQVVNNIQTSLSKISNLSDQLSSGVKVKYPSDDAVVALRVYKTNNNQKEVDQYQKNIDYAKNMNQIYDSSMQELSAVYTKMKSLLVEAANGTNGDDERNSIINELEVMKDHVEEIANTQFNGVYIFGGTQTDSKPVVDGEISIPYESNVRKSTTVMGYKLEYGVTAYDVFSLGNGKNAFGIFDDAISAMKGGDEKTISDLALGQVPYLQKAVTDNTAKIGATSNSIEMISSRLDDLGSFMKEYVSKEQDADVVKVYTDLAMQQSVLNAALSTASDVLKKSLVDYLR
jgi:flagellar hook-associated protein 3 FlgL